MLHWETEIVNFLLELSVVQEDTLSMLVRKGEMLSKGDSRGLEKLAKEENDAMNRLQACLDKREKMLQIAKAEGLPDDSIESLAIRIDKDIPGKPLEEKCRNTKHKARLLQHQSLTNWVMTQRTLIHLSQMLEIIATKGRPTSTYNSKRIMNKSTGGALVDLVSK